MAKNFDHLSHLKSSATRDVTSEEFFGLTPTSDNSEDSGSSPIKMNLSKRPTADNLVEGEIAVNYLKGHETLSIKNSEGEIVGFISENEIQENNEILVKGISQEAKDRIDACEAISKKVETHEAESAYQTIEVTMEELYNLKSTEKLKPGNSYRITDYNTKTNTSMTDIRSQEFHYDVIVTATSTTTLSEIAKAAKAKVGSASSEFDDCNLDAWELRFRMGFDKEEFPWAYYSGDSTKYGVVYYMKDEHGNETPYDFKNIQFKRYKFDLKKGSDFSIENVYAAPSTNKPSYSPWTYTYNIYDTEFAWFYTFSALKVTWDSTNHKFTAPTSIDSSSAIFDASIVNVKNLYNTDENANNGCSNNVIKPYYTNGNKVKAIHNLNNNIMLGWFGDYSSMESDYQTGTSDPGLTYNLPHDNYFASNCRENTLSFGSWGNKLGEGCYQNLLGVYNGNSENIYGNILGQNCYRNIFGHTFYNNHFGNVCIFNLVRGSVWENVIGNEFRYNIIYSSVYQNSIGNNFSSGNFQELRQCTVSNDMGYFKIGNDGGCRCCFFGDMQNNISINSFIEGCFFSNHCQAITISAGSNPNTDNCNGLFFGPYCEDITIGANTNSVFFGCRCVSITLGNNCDNNVFLDGCKYIYVYSGSSGTTALGYFQNNVFETNQHLTIRTTQTTSSSNLIRNNFFALGINNATAVADRKTITIDTLNATYKTTYQNANSTSVSV